MSSQIEIQSTSVDQAVEEALERFGASSREELDIEIIEEPKDGFFLGFGSKKARIKASLKNSAEVAASDNETAVSHDAECHDVVDKKEEVKSENKETEEVAKNLSEEEKEIVCDTIDLFLENISYSFDMDFHREIIIRDRNIDVNINGDDVANLIGRRGQTLIAIQHLMNIIVSRTLEFKVRIDLDISGYKGRRKNSLQKMAREAAKKVESTGKEVSLEPMDAASRKTIHVYLRDFDNVSTLSVGEGDRRFVIVVPEDGGSKKKSAKKNSRPRRRRRRKPASAEGNMENINDSVNTDESLSSGDEYVQQDQASE